MARKKSFVGEPWTAGASYGMLFGGEREKILSEIHALNTRRGAAEAMNALLEEQAKAEHRLDELLALDPAMEARRKALAQAEAAYRKAMPALEKADRAAEERNDHT